MSCCVGLLCGPPGKDIALNDMRPCEVRYVKVDANIERRNEADNVRLAGVSYPAGDFRHDSERCPPQCGRHEALDSFPEST
jgi:hypothetical protein